MKFNLTEFLIKKADLYGRDTLDPGVRSSYGYLEGWVSLVLNFLLFVVKTYLGIVSGSISIIADAVHTVSDVGTSAVVIWGFMISKKPADKEHPFGHGRMENIATLIIAVLVCVIGFEILQTAFMRLSRPVAVRGNLVIIGMLVISMCVKEWMARFSFDLARQINSSTLEADAWHHRSDAVSTLLVIAAITGSLFRLFRLDAFFGAIVAVYIMYAGIKLMRQASFHLLGKAADEQLQNKIKNIALSVDGVEGVHDIVAHDYGAFKAISLHVEVAPALNSTTAHQIATTVETYIAKNIPSSPIVHIDLKRQKKKGKSANFRIMEKVVKGYPEIIGFHGIELLSNESGDFLNLHIVISKHATVAQAHELEHRLRESLQRYFKEHKITMHIEPCNSQCDRCSQPCKD